MKESDKLNFYLYELTEGIDIQQQGWFQFFLHDLTYVKGYLIIEIFFSLGLVDPSANEEPKDKQKKIKKLFFSKIKNRPCLLNLIGREYINTKKNQNFFLGYAPIIPNINFEILN